MYLAGVAAAVQFRRLGDGQRLVVGLDKPRLRVEVDQLAVLLPVDGEKEVGVGHCVAPVKIIIDNETKDNVYNHRQLIQLYETIGIIVVDNRHCCRQ